MAARTALPEANGTLYECAVNVNEAEAGSIETYMILRSLDGSLSQSISALPDIGYHNLAQTTSSGAIDYIRGPLVSEREGCLTA